MHALATSLKEYVEKHLASALARDAQSMVRPVLVGPPNAALVELFGILTGAGSRDWQVAGKSVVVLLVADTAASPGSSISRVCHWDYAVTVRNSAPLVVILAARASWDQRPESLANTTETLGDLGLFSRLDDDPLQTHVVAAVASRLAIDTRSVLDLVRVVKRESDSLEPAARDALVWELFEQLLSVPPTAVPEDAACFAAGLPPVATSGKSFREAYAVLQSLARFVAKVGLRSAIDQMKGTTAASARGLAGGLESLRDHLADVLISPTAFETAPSRYYRVGFPVPGWYDALPATVIEEILAELRQTQPQDRLTITCENALSFANPLPGGPYIVEREVHLRASSKSGLPVASLAFTAKADRQPEVAISQTPPDLMRAIDFSPPVHQKPIKYTAAAPNHRPGRVDVLVLNQFGCGGLLFARAAEKNPVPVFAARGRSWTQELELPRGGNTEVSILHQDAVAHIEIQQEGVAPVRLPTQAGRCAVSSILTLENNDALLIRCLDSSGTILGEWTVNITVKDISDIADSRLEALILQHRNRTKYIPHAPDIPVHRLELDSYLELPESWRPALACWSGRIPPQLAIDWGGRAALGDVEPQIDPRPPVTPPREVLQAREVVRDQLRREQRCVSEIELSTPVIQNAVLKYLSSYSIWLAAAPEEAAWFDVLAIHSTSLNPQAGKHVASEEPVVVLLSPLHPIRLAWNVTAQQQLVDSLLTPCPAAGLISPMQCPDSALLYLRDGQATHARAFFSLPCEHPHWAVLMNTLYLDRHEQRNAAMARLSELGLDVQTITGGFTSQQTQDSLDEVNRLLPARATLRVGIIGNAETSSECAQGVMAWSEVQYGDAKDALGSLQLEVFDTRGAPDPSPEELAALSEATGERVRWFKLHPEASVPKLDLTIIDQLGIISHEAAHADSYSAVSDGCLYRVRIREDFHDARAIVESRISRTRTSGTTLSQLLPRVVEAFEGLVARDTNHSHFRFTPNQEAVGSRLRNAIFLSVTSSQIDPACIARGAVGQQGYLWDYELPGVLGGGETSLGYYLVAKPTDAMCDAIERAASLVVTPPPEATGLLEEVSRHGIPILKRLASGGSQSRGELGLLLATRLLQDSFRLHATTARLPVWSGTCIHLILPVDPYEELFDALRASLLGPLGTAQRPDLVVIAIQLPDNSQAVAIKVTPIEVKFRAAGMSATDMRDALSQAENLGLLLQKLWVGPPHSDLWRTCSSALLAQFIDFGFRIYGATRLHGHTHEEWTGAHERVIRDILEGTARLSVSTPGKALIFGGAPATYAADLDGDTRRDTLVVSMDDARALLGSSTPASPEVDHGLSTLDFSLPGCISAPPYTPSSSVPSGVRAISAVALTATATPPDSIVSARQDKSAVPRDAEKTEGPSSPVLGQSASRIPSEIRQHVKEAFAGFIGNEPAVARLSNDLLRALIENPPHLAKNYLFTGLPSTGKTELARRMADALRLPFIKLDGRGVSGRDKLFDLINGELNTAGLVASQVGQQVGLSVLEYPPLVVFIDEVHLVPRALQESLLTMLEAADRTVVLASHVARVHRATFLFATTRSSDVDAAFVSRCDEIQLREYSEEEVAQILKWKLPHDDWPPSVYVAIARLGRCVPRIAIQLAGALETAVLVSEHEKPISDHLEDVRRAREIDPRGLTRMDFEYLRILERSNNPVGEQNILNLMRTVDKERVLNEIEPFLVRLGLIKHGPRGRELTVEGREYVLAQRAAGPP